MAKMSKIGSSAIKWREQPHEHVSSVVLVWNNESCGLKDKIRNPEHKQPSAYAVDDQNHAFIATDGNDYDEAKCWVVSEA